MTDPLAPIERRQRQDVNLLYRTLADALRNATAGMDPEQTVTAIEASQIRRAVEKGVGVIFGRFPGDTTAAIRTMVVQDAARARLQPLDAMVKRYRQAMSPRLRELVEADARG